MKELNDDSINFQKVMTMAEKAVNRLVRRNYYNRKQYPEIIFQIQDAFETIHTWIKNYRMFSCFKNYHLVLSLCVKRLTEMIIQLIDKCKPVKGKRKIKNSTKQKEQRKLSKDIVSMLTHLEDYIGVGIQNTVEFHFEFEKAILKAFEIHCVQEIYIDTGFLVSSRGEKTYVFPWPEADTYIDVVNNRDRFKSEIVKDLSRHVHETGHKKTCKGPKSYRLCGFRAKPRRTVMQDGKKESAIRIVQCKTCGERFSLLPSFLPREKNFGIDIIGNVFENMFRFSLSIQGALQNLKILRRGVRSKQTILNWSRWMGFLHPATVLTRAGITGSGYIQEDEGFEKEPHLRTYSVVMVDPRYLLVWHSDYVDHVDEKTLTSSFEKFMEKIDFKILGVTKDKWRPSTNALKAVFNGLWLGFCHRHCLKNLYKDLLKYQEQTQCPKKEVKRIYKKIKKVLKTSNSKVQLQVKLNSIKEPAFEHPILCQRLNDIKENAAYYTSHKNRKGISQTTSIVDNFLKTIKRKLRQVESFRDPEHTRLLFRAMANARNFLPFLPGAKNAHKSPFMLAGGETCNLPWIQTLNVHNAFLFTDNAF